MTTMQEFIQEPLGWIHTAAALLAMCVGAWLLSKPKGTREHRYLGHVFFVSMLLLNLSAIPITNMTGSVGLFHVFVAISLPTTLAAMYFPLFGRQNSNWKKHHFAFTYWSYVGLIAAFVAEALVRLPILLLTDRELADRAMEAAGGFWLAVVVMFVVMAVAEMIFRSYRKRLFG